MIAFGVLLRARIPFLQRNLVPASLIGGVLGFTLITAGFSFGLTSAQFTPFAFHFFTLSFMSLVLTGPEKPNNGRSIAKGGLWLALIWGMSLVLQAMVALGVVLAYNAATGQTLSVFLGMIATHGFTQGPGQALAMGTIWETTLGVEHAVNFGLVYASAGFLAAFLVGVPAARWVLKRGLNQNQTARITPEFLTGLWQRDVSAGRQITHPANVDSLVFHLAILGIAYVLTNQYLLTMQELLSTVTLGKVNAALYFSHNLFFVHGLIVCLLLRYAMNRLGIGHLIDNETQRRLTGSSVDLMVVATLMSVQFAFLQAYVVPLLLVCVAITLATALLCLYFGRRLAELGPERAVTLFGCCCGSTGSGLLLLRIMDPDLSTPVPKELAFFNIAVLVVSAHILMVMAPVLPAMPLSTIATVYLGTFVASALVLVWFYGRRH